MAVGRSFVRLLNAIGYRARLAAIPQRDYYARTQDPRERMQMGSGVWLGESPAASNIIPPLLSCKALRTRATALSNNQAQFCDPALDTSMERAHTLEATEPAAASRIWARIDQALVRRAPVIPLYSGQVAQVTSTRVGNYQYHPRLGPVLAQAWLR
jgi:peptide/nickel transport system substrate-binding protein